MDEAIQKKRQSAMTSEIQAGRNLGVNKVRRNKCIRTARLQISKMKKANKLRPTATLRKMKDILAAL